MLGPLGRSAAPGRRRVRGRTVAIAVVCALLVALVLGEVIDQVVKAAKPAARRGDATWVAAVAPIVGESNDLASVLREVRGLADLPRCAGAGCERRTFDAYLGQLVTGTRGGIAQLASVGLMAPSTRAEQLLDHVLLERAHASRDLVGALSLLLGTSRGPSVDALAQARLVKAGSELTASDAAYRALVQSLPRVRGAIRLAPSTWIRDARSWTPGGLQSWVARLLASPGLRATDEIALDAISTSPPVLRIQDIPATPTTSTRPTSTTTTSTTTTTLPRTPGATTTSTTSTTSTTTTTTLPPPITTLQLPPAGAISVVQPTSRLTVQVVVADVGTTPAQRITLLAVLAPRPGRAKTVGASSSSVAHLGALAPGGARYVVLPAMSVRRGVSYTLTVEASVPGWTSAIDRVVIHVAR